MHSVSIPESVSSIGREAFVACENLKEVIIENSHAVIGDAAFSGCVDLADRNGMVIINNTLFGYFGNSEELIIPDGIEKIDEFAVQWCDNLKTVVIPDTVKSIGRAAFQMCSNLESVTMPESIAINGEGVFNGCEKLKKLNRRPIKETI